MKYLILLSLVRCATVPHRTLEDNIRDELTSCIATADNIQVLNGCYGRADNRCMNADLEPDCHGVSR